MVDRLIVGLGNPGRKYQAHRHNVGFMVIDRLAQVGGLPNMREKFGGEFCTGLFGGRTVGLLKPLTYMNCSGEAVQAAMHFFKVDVEEVIVVHDELDIEFGTHKLKVGGGIAGHNGLRSIVQHCGGRDFIRLRIGISRPPKGPVDGYVLSEFNSAQKKELSWVVDGAVDAVKSVLEHGISKTMNRVNTG